MKKKSVIYIILVLYWACLQWGLAQECLSPSSKFDETAGEIYSTNKSNNWKIYTDFVPSITAADFAFAELERALRIVVERYSNVHRGTGQHSVISTELFEHARVIILDYLKLDQNEYVVIFNNPRRTNILIDHLKDKSSYKVLFSNTDAGLPLGVGALAVKRKDLPDQSPFVGGGTVKNVGDTDVVYDEAPAKFEAGTPNIPGVIAMAKALKIIESTGDKDIFRNGVKNSGKYPSVYDSIQSLTHKELLLKLKDMFMGNGAVVPTAKGDAPYINLDNAASTPPFLPTLEDVFLTWRKGVTGLSDDLSETENVCLDFFNAGNDYDCIFTSNTTDGINIVAESFKLENKNGSSSMVIGTDLEHNSNELPWRYIGREPGDSLIRIPVDDKGFFDSEQLEEMLKDNNVLNKHENKHIRIVTLSGASNVLGTFNDLKKISDIAHKYNAYIHLDAAQLAAHQKIDMKKLGIDYISFAGHKMYAPFGTGGLIARKGLLNFGPEEMEKIKNSGKENIIGIIAMTKVMKLLKQIDLDLIEKEEAGLTKLMIKKFMELNEKYKKVYDQKEDIIDIYGIKDFSELDKKGPVVTINIKGIPHNVVAKMLAELRGVGVRNKCFCAHRLIRSLICTKRKKTGMCKPHTDGPGLVRISIGLENTENDILHFIDTLDQILADPKARPAPSELKVCPFLATDDKTSKTSKIIDLFTAGVVNTVYSTPDIHSLVQKNVKPFIFKEKTDIMAIVNYLNFLEGNLVNPALSNADWTPIRKEFLDYVLRIQRGLKMIAMGRKNDHEPCLNCINTGLCPAIKAFETNSRASVDDDCKTSTRQCFISDNDIQIILPVVTAWKEFLLNSHFPHEISEALKTKASISKLYPLAIANAA